MGTIRICGMILCLHTCCDCNSTLAPLGPTLCPPISLSVWVSRMLLGNGHKWVPSAGTEPG